MDSPYEVLGVDPAADEATVVRAYRRRVMETHPDQGGSEREFRRVQAAYERIRAGDAPEEGATARPRTVAVEYLDYEVLIDRGWPLGDAAFERAAAADLDRTAHGRFAAERGDSILEAAEKQGFHWPFACRGGACANCAVVLLAGDVEMPRSNVLPPEMVERGVRLSCISEPLTADVRVIFNVKHRPDLEELRLPADRFEASRAGD